MAFFDNRIVDADTPSYASANLSWEAILKRAAMTKSIASLLRSFVAHLSLLFVPLMLCCTVNIQPTTSEISGIQRNELCKPRNTLHNMLNLKSHTLCYCYLAIRCLHAQSCSK